MLLNCKQKLSSIKSFLSSDVAQGGVDSGGHGDDHALLASSPRLNIIVKE